MALFLCHCQFSPVECKPPGNRGPVSLVHCWFHNPSSARKALTLLLCLHRYYYPIKTAFPMHALKVPYGTVRCQGSRFSDFCSCVLSTNVCQSAFWENQGPHKEKKNPYKKIQPYKVKWINCARLLRALKMLIYVVNWFIECVFPKFAWPESLVFKEHLPDLAFYEINFGKWGCNSIWNSPLIKLMIPGHFAPLL